MAANETDKFQKVGDATVTTLAAPGKAIGATSITVGSTTNYPTDTGVTIAIRVVDSSGDLVAGTYTEYVGTVTSGTSFAINGTPVYGSDQVYAAGSTTQVYIGLSKYAHNKMIDGLLVSLDQDGTLKAGAVDVAGVIASGIITNTQMSTEVKPYTLFDETTFDFVASGCVWTADAAGSTLLGSMTAGVVYIDGQRVAVSAVTAHAFTASKDTYVDVGLNGTVDYSESTLNAASQTLAASHLRLGIVVSGASSIANAAAINQGEETKVLPIASSIPYTVTDSLGNLICNRDPNSKTLGYRQTIANQAKSTTGNTDLTGLAVPVIVPANRKIKITISILGGCTGGAADNANTIRIYEGANQLQSGAFRSPASIVNVASSPVLVTSPTAGLHTYKGVIEQQVANTQTYNSGATQPGFILVELA